MPPGLVAQLESEPKGLLHSQLLYFANSAKNEINFIVALLTADTQTLCLYQTEQNLPDTDKEQIMSATLKIMKAKKEQAAKDASNEGDAPPMSDETEATDAVESVATVQEADTPVETAPDIISDGEDAAPVEEKKPAKKATATATKTKTKTETAPTDLIKITASEIENLTESQAGQQLHLLMDTQSFDQFKIGGILAKIQTEGWFGEHPNFRSYVEAEHSIQYRTAMLWVAMYNDVLDSGVAWDKLKHLGWTKISIIAPILTPDNVDGVLEAVADMNTVSVRAYVQSFEGETPSSKTATEQEINNLKSKTFKLFEGQKETVDLAIEKAKKEAGTDADSAALEFICTDYVSNGAKKPDAKTVYTFDPNAAMDFPLDDLFKAIREQAEDLPTAVQHILVAVGNVIPEANISVELDDE